MEKLTPTMIKYIAVIICSAVMINAASNLQRLELKPGDKLKLRHTPDEGSAETDWELKACEGCKIALSCVILSRSCDDHLLTIFDGKQFHHFCGAEQRYVVKTSIHNLMSVTIKTEGLRSGSYCSLSTTKPYTNMQYETVDSSEHGQGKGATQQTSCKCGWSNKSPKRIVGGQEASVNEYPFAVLLMWTRRKQPYCGGSIITPYHVLTAAHCTYPFYGIQLSVIVGEHDLNDEKETPHTRVIDVEKNMDHPKYDGKTNVYDISVLKLKEKIEFNDAVGPVCMPNFRNRNLLNEYIRVMGWGHLRTNGTSSPVLLKVDLKVIDLEICRTIYNSIDTDNPFQICTWAKNKDSCQGDSGGPLVWANPETKRYTQVALVSYGRECASTDPAVNSDVSYFMDWIQEKIKESSPESVSVCM